MPSSSTDPILSRRTAVRLGGAGLAAALATQMSGTAWASDVATLEANKAIARRLFDVGVNGGDEAATAALYAPDYVDRNASARQMPGPAGMPVPLHEFRSAFPDVTVTVDAVVAEEDLVATRETWWNLHQPAGVHVVGRTMHFFRIANGLIVEQWSVGWEWLPRRDDQPRTGPRNPLAVP